MMTGCGRHAEEYPRTDCAACLRKVLGDPTQRVTVPAAPDMHEVWQQVKANHARLDGCVGPHDFLPLHTHSKINTRFKCSKCLGEATASDVSWYRKGLKHAAIT